MPKPENIVPHQFKPGQSGNPKGRQPGSKNVATILKRLLEERDKNEEGEGDYGSPLAKELIKLIFQKNTKGKYIHSETVRLRALEQAIERLEGKANLPISVSNTDDRPEFSITFRNGNPPDPTAELQRHEPKAD